MTHQAGPGQCASPGSESCRYAPRRSARIVAGVLAGALAFLFPTAALAEDPAQWWNSFAGSVKTGIGSIESKGETRLFEGGDINIWNAEVVLMILAGKRFTWGPGFKYQEARLPASHFIGEERFLMAGRWSAGKTGPWRWTVRGIVEYREIEDRPEFWRYRLRPEAKRAIGSSKWEFAASNEGYYDSARDAYSQNRVQLGVQRPLDDHTSLSIYYLLRSDRIAGHWEEIQVIGTAWSFR